MKSVRIVLCAAAIAAAGCSAKVPPAKTPQPSSGGPALSQAKALPSPQPALPAGTWPTRGWRTSNPGDQGMDSRLLDAALQSAQDQGLQLHGVLVIRHGYIVLEKYYGPYDEAAAHSLFSCTKSFISALTGIALARRDIPALDRTVLSFFPERRFDAVDERKKAITVRNLLTMTSGLAWSEGDETYAKMYATSRDWVKFVLDLPMASPPGASFTYCSGCSHLLSAIIQTTSGMNVYDFAEANLFGPLGIEHPHWEQDPSGIPIGGWGLSLSPRDMAKLGLLYLHGGKWDGRQVVPAAWVRESTQPHVRVDDAWQYGYQWWVDPQGAFYAAVGRYGQGIYVVPGLDLVAVFTAHIDSNDPETDLLRRYIIPACSTDHVTRAVTGTAQRAAAR